MCKFVFKKTSRDVELDTKWLVVAQKSSSGGRLNVKLVLKKSSRDVESDVKWRVIVHKCPQDDDLMCKFVKKKACWSEKITNKLHVISKNNFVVAQKSSTGGRLNAKFVLKKTSRDVELDEKWRVVVQKCQQDDNLMCKFVKKKARWSEKITNKLHVISKNNCESADICSVITSGDES